MGEFFVSLILLIFFAGTHGQPQPCPRSQQDAKTGAHKRVVWHALFKASVLQQQTLEEHSD
jgi:hypothetical protein